MINKNKLVDVNLQCVEEGDLVVLVSGEADNPNYPIWGGTQGHVRGVVSRISANDLTQPKCMVCVDWENGNECVYDNERNVIAKYGANYAMQKATAENSNADGSGSMVGDADHAIASIQMTSMRFYYDCEIDSAAKKKIEADAKAAHFDEAALDLLVVKREVREEIVALLKQSRNAGLIFDEWGLGKTIEYGRGMGMLFWGEPGTGKTWAANCIARAVGRELLVVNAANIQTSEPGGANRNIEQAFATAREQLKVLFLDECDSLITSRGDVGMILSSEINTLLTQIEKFEGICILATNRIGTLDEALERRLALIVEFPDPDFAARKAIWGVLVPKELPWGEGVDIERLAEYKLTGGQIKNVLLRAARLAAAEEKVPDAESGASAARKVELRHVEAAVRRSQRSKGLMGNDVRTRQAAGRNDYRMSHG